MKFGQIQIDNLERDADAKRWRKLCDMVNNDKASVIFRTIHTGLEVCDSGDLYDEIDDELKRDAE